MRRTAVHAGRATARSRPARRPGEVGGAVQQGVRALVRQLADRRGGEARLDQPGAQSVQTERCKAHHPVARHVHVVGGGRLLGGVRHQGLVDRLELDEADGLQQPELVVEPHHGVRDLFQDVVGGLAHVVGQDHRGGERGQRHRHLAERVLADGQQIQVAEHPVEEVGLRLGVPVQGGEIDLALPVHGVDEIAEVGHARVGQHGVERAEPDAEDVLRGAGGEQGEVLARADGALLLVDDLDEPGVDGHPPGLAGEGGGLVAGQAENAGGLGKLFLDEFAPAPTRVAGPAQRASRAARESSGAASAARASCASECSRTGGKEELSDIG